MFPIRDHNPSSRTPFVTYVLIAANVLIFFSYVPILGDERALYAMFWDYALIPGKLMEGGLWHPLVTSIFLHGGWMHLIGNMLFLWIFGDNMEDFFGHVGFALFYLACGIGAGLIQVAASPWSDIPTVGASGAIAGVLGGYILLFPKARVDILFIFIVFFKVIPIPAWVMLGVWFGLQVFNGVTTSTDGGGVAYWAHIGGFVFGFLFTLPFWRRRGGTGYWQASHGHPPHPDAEYKFVKSHVPVVKRRR